MNRRWTGSGTPFLSLNVRFRTGLEIILHAHCCHQPFVRFFKITSSMISPQEMHLHPEKSSISWLENLSKNMRPPHLLQFMMSSLRPHHLLDDFSLPQKSCCLGLIFIFFGFSPLLWATTLSLLDHFKLKIIME